MGDDVELCIDCNEPTGFAGEGEDSLYYNGKGPYCEECYDLNEMLDNPDLLLIHIADLIDAKKTDQWSSDQLREMANDFKKGKYKTVKQ